MDFNPPAASGSSRKMLVLVIPFIFLGIAGMVYALSILTTVHLSGFLHVIQSGSPSLISNITTFDTVPFSNGQCVSLPFKLTNNGTVDMQILISNSLGPSQSNFTVIGNGIDITQAFYPLNASQSVDFLAKWCDLNAPIADYAVSFDVSGYA